MPPEVSNDGAVGGVSILTDSTHKDDFVRVKYKAKGTSEKIVTSILTIQAVNRSTGRQECCRHFFGEFAFAPPAPGELSTDMPNECEAKLQVDGLHDRDIVWMQADFFSTSEADYQAHFTEWYKQHPDRVWQEGVAVAETIPGAVRVGGCRVDASNKPSKMMLGR